MRDFIKHLLTEHPEQITKDSLLHCHTKGLHSVMFLNEPERRLRMFVSTPESGMWQNFPSVFEDNAPLSIAFHPHHCNLTLSVVKGSILNWTTKVSEGEGMTLEKFFFDSKLIGHGTGFMHLGTETLESVSQKMLYSGQYEYMTADQIHTVAVPRGQYAAWLVYEGREDPNYVPYSWSNTDLQKLTFDGLYEKPDMSDINELLRIAGIE